MITESAADAFVNDVRRRDNKVRRTGQLRLFEPPVIYNGWVADTTGPPVCAHCHWTHTPEGHDPCIPNLPGTLSACCGHGLTEPYIALARPGGPQTDDEYFARTARLPTDQWCEYRGERLFGEPAAARMRELGGNPPARRRGRAGGDCGSHGFSYVGEPEEACTGVVAAGPYAPDVVIRKRRTAERPSPVALSPDAVPEPTCWRAGRFPERVTGRGEATE